MLEPHREGRNTGRFAIGGNPWRSVAGGPATEGSPQISRRYDEGLVNRNFSGEESWSGLQCKVRPRIRLAFPIPILPIVFHRHGEIRPYCCRQDREDKGDKEG